MAGDMSNPFDQYQLNSGQDLRNQSMQMRMMMNADRMAQSGMPRTRYAGARGSMGGNPMMGAMTGGEPDYSPFSYDAQLNAQARAAGVTPLDPSQVKQNAVLPNSGFFGNHPRLSGMLEGGLFGAMATRGSDTVGEGISNVASGLIEGRQARQNILGRQFAQPFQSAGVIENLRDRATQRELRESDIQKNRAEAQHWANEDARLKNTMAPIERPLGIPASDSSIMEADPSRPGQFIQRENKFYDPKTAPGAGQAKGSPFDQIVTAHNAERAAKGLGPLDSKQLEQVNDRIAGGTAGAREWAMIAAQLKTGYKLPDNIKMQYQTASKELLDPTNKQLRESITQSIINDPNYTGDVVGPGLESKIDEEITRRNMQTVDKLKGILDSVDGPSPMPKSNQDSSNLLNLIHGTGQPGPKRKVLVEGVDF